MKPNEISDDPSADGTDLAHPAWWRGYEYGTNSIIFAINRILNETNPTVGVVFVDPQLEDIRTKIRKLKNSQN